MKKAFKPVKIILMAVMIPVIILFSASLVLQDRIARLVMGYLNSNIPLKIEYASARLSFLSRFPRASLELGNVLVRSSRDFDTSGFGNTGTDTLLSAKSVSVELSLAGILKEKYRIKRLVIRSGKINLLTGKEGRTNYDLKSGRGTPGGGSFEMDLEGIILSEVEAVYHDLPARILLSGQVEKSRLKTRITRGSIDFSATSSMHMEVMDLWGIHLPGNLQAVVDVEVRHSGDTTFFRKGTLKLDEQAFDLKGSIYPGNVPDLNIAGQKVDLEKAISALPGTILAKFRSYHPGGKMRMVADITAPVSPGGTPHIDITALLAKGHITRDGSRIAANDLSFSASFTNGKKNSPATSALSFDDMGMKFGSSRVTGSLSFTRFNDLEASATLKGIVKPDEVRDFFGLSYVTYAAGSAETNLRMSGKVPPGFNYTLSGLLSSARGNVIFSDFSLALRNSEFDVRQANGEISISELITAQKLSFRYKDHPIRVDGSFRDFPEWLSGKSPVLLTGTALVDFARLDPAKLFGWDKEKTGTTPNGPISIPASFNLNLDFKADTFIYRSFLAEKVSGHLAYKKSEMNFSRLDFKTLEGNVKGSGIFYQNPDKSVIVKGIFNIDDIDIKKAFVSFRNFGQEFIKAENLDGRLSGSLSMLLPMNSSLDPEIKFLTAEGKYTITKGSLTNFEPVKKLSSYIELSELQNITFDKLENDFYIRNNFFYVPGMGINSSAVTLTVNGRHSFDNDYTYHVKMLLSEVLSRKFRRNRVNREDFGPVQDDGLGRTSLLLKVEGKGDVIKTGYDIKAAGEGIRSSVKAEKSNLKTILKEEYGWFKKDSAAAPAQPSKQNKEQPRFRVVWDENGNP